MLNILINFQHSSTRLFGRHSSKYRQKVDKDFLNARAP